MTESQRREVHRRVLEILMIAEPSRIDDEAIAIQADNVRKARFRSREFARTSEIKERLADVKVPVRAIWGERDVLAKPTLSHLFDVLRQHQPDLVTRVVADAGHGRCLFRYPTRRWKSGAGQAMSRHCHPPPDGSPLDSLSDRAPARCTGYLVKRPRGCPLRVADRIALRRSYTSI
jgi:hypothetical protein